MNIYRLSVGYFTHYVAAADEAEATVKGAQFPGLSFMPFNVEQVIVPGHTITATPEGIMSRDAMKQWLKDNGVEFTPQWGDEKLRELIAQHTESA